MKNEFGRSMVEILGVLAIMGVISIGGIQSYKNYRTAITRHKVNEIIDVCRVILQEESTRLNTDKKKLTLSSVWSGRLPEDECWISSYAGNSNNLYIGGCSEEVMNGIANILGGNRWKQRPGATCGEMLAIGQPGGPEGLLGRYCSTYEAGTQDGYSVYKNSN